MRLLFCAENLLSVEQFGNHVLTAEETAAGFPVSNIASGRREPGSRWQPSTTNVDRYVRCVFDKLRAFDFFAIDRASNARGFRYVAESSADSFVTKTALWDLTLPTIPGGQVAGAVGAVTDEDAWLKTITPVEANHGVQLTSKAMGTGLVPNLTNVWVGKAWQPAGFVQFRHGRGQQSMRSRRAFSETGAGWRGYGRAMRRREAELHLHLSTPEDMVQLEYQVLGLCAAGFPAWVVWDRDDGSRYAALVSLEVDAMLDSGPQFELPNRRQIVIPFCEEQPRP